LYDQLKFSKQRHPGCGIAPGQGDSSVTFAMQRANQNGCPFYYHEIVISLVKGVL
jgi:hypothetical protein